MRPLPIFIHIPRTGGTTIRRITGMQLEPEEELQVYGSDIESPQRVCAEFPVAHWNRLRLVRGHMSYGIHKVIPRECVYFTVLREPTARVLSWYKHLKMAPAHPFHSLARRHSLATMINFQLSHELDNGQVRQLCGTAGEFPQLPGGPTKVPFGGCTRVMLLQAMENLKKFAVVGTLEAFDESVQRICKVLGWRVMTYKKYNVTPARPAVRDLPRSTVYVIHKANQLDAELYRWVVGGMK